MNRLSTLAAALAALGLLTLSCPAGAQQAAATAGAAAKPDQLQEIVVTAQKTAQSASKVAASLSTITGDDLIDKGITDASGLTQEVPNVQIGAGNRGGMEITIRGIGNSDPTERGDPDTAFHIDGVYIGRTEGAGAALFDLERVEVLRGPQGTLYGRNANAGAINVITNKPSKKYEGEVDATVGTYATRNVNAMVNVPISGSFSLRAVASTMQHAGYAPTANAADGFTESLDDQDSLSGRLEGLYRFSSHMSWLMTVDGTHNQGAGQAAYVITPGSLPTSRAQTPQVQGSVNDSGLGVTSEFKADLGFADFTYLFGHRKTTRDDILTNGPAPSTYAPYSDAFMQNSHELRLNSARAGRLQWVAGLYYFKEVGSNINLAVLLPPAFGGGLAIQFIQNPAISQSKAVFGQATYALAPDWRATLGLRSNADAKSRVGETIGGNGKPIGNIGNLAHGTWNKLTYKLGVEHDLAGGQMAYATFATGYKAGGYNDGNGVVGDPNYNPSLYYKPETITSTEAGVKGHYFDHRLELGISAFHYAYTDLQVGGVVNNSLVTLNAAKAAVDGLEFEGRAIVGEDGMLNFALGTLNARYNQYSAPDGSSLSGQALDRAPKATLTLGYTQNWDLQGGSRISATLGTRYSSSYRLTDPGTATRAPLSFIQKANTNSSVSVAYWGANQKWHAEIYGKSLENTIRINSIASVNGTDYGYLAEPRTFGVRGVFSF